ncbi:MAG: hypothetical protein MK033_02975 [Candidatus Caenarcaniphilales bacterium]|nr:hypothetical protein [Candidatus Caenarcaniphilales bacterium]
MVIISPVYILSDRTLASTDKTALEPQIPVASTEVNSGGKIDRSNQIKQALEEFDKLRLHIFPGNIPEMGLDEFVEQFKKLSGGLDIISSPNYNQLLEYLILNPRPMQAIHKKITDYNTINKRQNLNLEETNPLETSKAFQAFQKITGERLLAIRKVIVNEMNSRDKGAKLRQDSSENQGTLITDLHRIQEF